MPVNIIDIIILAILGVSVLFGLYRGFIASVSSLGVCLLSLGLSYWLSPKLVSYISSNPSLVRTLMSYTDAATRIGDQTLAQTEVSALGSGAISDILARVNLPGPLNSLLQRNLETQIFEPSHLTKVGDYVSQTIVGAMLNVICFVICFIICIIVLHFALNFLKAVFHFPVLKQMNSLFGGIFGLLRGVLFCFVAFALLPLVQTISPLEQINEIIAGSTLAPLFNSSQLILSIINGSL